MSAIITKINRIETAKDYIAKNFTSAEGNTTHFYIGQSIPWDDEYSPDVSISNDQQIMATLRQRIFLKKWKKK